MNDVQSLLLQVIGASLFGGKTPMVVDNQISPLISESKVQAVFPLLFSALDGQLRQKLSPEQYAKQNEEFLRYAIAGTQNFAEHTELHELMTANGIPYVVIKGFASAMYYPEPELRNMGDVDFLISKSDFQSAEQALESAGFMLDHGSEDTVHISYQRPPASIWEMHRTVNGIPDNAVGALIQEEIGTIVETAVQEEIDGFICRVPDRFHHGLIVLLHTASHLTSEGVGLRHLCDWVVFALSMSDPEFREVFEKKLKKFGLWRFAQVLTLLGDRYLGAPKRVWAIEALESKKIDEKQLEGLMNDILSGGNFGMKDSNRYREIKYISNRGEHTVSSGGIFSQGIRSLNKRIRVKHSFIGKHKLLYPIGYVAEGGRYIGLILTGKRKNSGTKIMLKEASERKKIYASLNLFCQ